MLVPIPTDHHQTKLPPRDHHQHQRISSTIRPPPPIPECCNPCLLNYLRPRICWPSPSGYQRWNLKVPKTDRPTKWHGLSIAFVKLPVFGKQISCQFGGLLNGHWPQMMKWNQHPSAEEVTQPPRCEESGSAWCGFGQLPSWRKLYDRDLSGNWGIGGKLGSNTQYTMRGKLLSIDAHL